VHLGTLAFCLVLVVAPLAAEAQNLPRIGLLSIGADPSRPVAWSPFLERLRELGYVEGGTLRSNVDAPLEGRSVWTNWSLTWLTSGSTSSSLRECPRIWLPSAQCRQLQSS